MHKQLTTRLARQVTTNTWSCNGSVMSPLLIKRESEVRIPPDQPRVRPPFGNHPSDLQHMRLITDKTSFQESHTEKNTAALTKAQTSGQYYFAATVSAMLKAKKVKIWKQITKSWFNDQCLLHIHPPFSSSRLLPMILGPMERIFWRWQENLCQRFLPMY